MVLWLYTWQERHAATLGPAESASGAGTETETEGPRHDQHGRTAGDQQHGKGNEDGRTRGPPREQIPPRERAADPPPILQAANGTKAPSASTPGSTSRAHHSNTSGPPHQHRRTTAPPPTATEDGRTGGQTETERREGTATPGHGEAPGQHRKRQNKRAGPPPREQTAAAPQDKEQERKQAATLPEDETETEGKARKHLDTQKTLFFQAMKSPRTARPAGD